MELPKKELPEIVTVADIAEYCGVARSSVYDRLEKLKMQGVHFPPCIPGSKCRKWRREEIKKYLIYFQTFSPQGERVRVKFGKQQEEKKDVSIEG